MKQNNLLMSLTMPVGNAVICAPGHVSSLLRFCSVLCFASILLL